ncbi:MAG: M23 family metallopeptidase [Bryobacteraceae bacterium]
MKQDYFIVVLAHSLHGRLRRIHIPHQVLYAVFILVIFGCFSVFGFVGSYARMAWKVSNYNSLRKEADSLRTRYERLQRTVNQTNEQLATLQMFADEVSAAYGIKKKIEGPSGILPGERLVPTMSETLQEYNYLRASNLSRFERTAYKESLHPSMLPSLWPVDGRLTGGFGQRSDPFSGEGALHTGVDISVPVGTQVHAAADGIVVHAGFNNGYGRLIVIDHGNGYQTYYGHLSRMHVIEGQDVRRGDTVGESGSSGRSTGPHLHYEVRIGQSPVNPYRFLIRPQGTPAALLAKNDFPF